MPSIKEYIQKLFDANNISYSDKQAAVFTEFVSEEDNIFAFHQIVDNQNILITRFMRKVAIFDIIHQHLQIPNGTVNKPYLHTIDLAKLGNGQITTTALPDIEKYGLSYNTETATITGTPTQSGDFKVALHFNIAGEDDLTPPHLKTISLVINADPKSLWKNIPSDEGQDDAWRHKNHWKADNAMATAPLGGKHLVVASKRGRSHANVGSFRDDDFAFEHFAENGWSIVCVADGAGSAKLSRRGSQLACEAVVKYFAEQFTADVLAEADRLIQERSENPGEDNQKGLSAFLYKYAGGAAFSAHQTLEAAANKMEVSLKDLHSTLIFALFKQYEFGYAIFSFGVGDCPIAVLNTSMTDVKLMNWLDVGEFGGGTRFITMSEIFQSDKFATRFGFQLMPDFSYLILMTDGIYDPKFVVEANLEKPVHWQAFIADLKGDNEDKKQVHFDPANTAIAQELSDWMDFWSPGNHDDRTLAIVF